MGKEAVAIEILGECCEPRLRSPIRAARPGAEVADEEGCAMLVWNSRWRIVRADQIIPNTVIIHLRSLCGPSSEDREMEL